ncbi:MAG: 3-deoxy-7-phosphoheptulonate synthase [Phycisphaerae bacterium]
MLVVMRTNAHSEALDQVCDAIRALGLTPHPIPGRTRTAIGVTGNTAPVDAEPIRNLPGVIEVIRVTKPYKLTSREVRPDDTVIRVGDVAIGGGAPVVIAGPCSVESHEQTVGTAIRLRSMGAHLLRGGAFKPRTSPYAFQGLGPKGLEILSQAREESGLPIITEAVGTEAFDLVEEVADVIQIGSRNMHNVPLLKRAGKSAKPIFLKRHMSATLEEFLLAAEYVMSEGNHQVILCERGIRTFSDHSRFTLDINIVPELKRLSHLPVFVDPSHAAGRRDLVGALARAGIAAGADGLIVEVHPEPEKALSDGPQALTIPMFEELMSQIGAIATAIGEVGAAT